MNLVTPISVNWRKPSLEAFKASLNNKLDADDVGGKKGRPFGRELVGVDQDQLPSGLVKRSEVFALAADATVNTATVCAAAMAWGGMNMRFHREFFKLGDDGWLSVADGIRSGKLSRMVAYDSFCDLRKKGKLYGVGPAYFTKLLYFLTPRGRGDCSQGYIMDQWAGCSINLLRGEEVALMNVAKIWHRGDSKPRFTFTVSDANTGANYEAFCATVDSLRELFELCPDKIDRALLGNGGKKKSDWRQYVIDHRDM